MMFGKQLFWHPRLLFRFLTQRIRSDSLLRNSIYIMGTGVTTSAFGYLYWLLATHTYSAFDVGLGSALISAMMLASALSNLGIGSTLVQVLPRCKTGYAWSLTLNAGLATGAFSGLLAGVIVLITLPLLSPRFAVIEHDLGYALILVVGVPLMTLSLLLDQTFVAERAGRNMLLRNAAYAVLKIPLLVLPTLLLTRVGALGVFSSWVLAAAITVVGGMLLLIPRLRSSYSLTVGGIAGRVRSLLSSLAGHHFINIGGLAPTYLLPVFVAIRLSPTDNAYFYITTRLGDFFFMASSAVAVSLFAEGSHAEENLLRKVRSSALLIGIILAPAMLICFFGGSYILLLFGPGYAAHGLLLLRILVIAAVPDAITNIYISVLRVQQRLRYGALLNLSMASLDLTLAWILLPIQGIAGAGWSFLIAQSIGGLIALIAFVRISHHQRPLSGSTKRLMQTP